MVRARDTPQQTEAETDAQTNIKTSERVACFYYRSQQGLPSSLCVSSSPGQQLLLHPKLPVRHACLSRPKLRLTPHVTSHAPLSCCLPPLSDPAILHISPVLSCLSLPMNHSQAPPQSGPDQTPPFPGAC